jgi:hypothetical protein
VVARNGEAVTRPAGFELPVVEAPADAPAAAV